jgi:hypothetical protein
MQGGRDLLEKHMKDIVRIAQLVTKEGGFQSKPGRGLYRLMLGEDDPKGALPSLEHVTELAAGYEQLPAFLQKKFGDQLYLPEGVSAKQHFENLLAAGEIPARPWVPATTSGAAQAPRTSAPLHPEAEEQESTLADSLLHTNEAWRINAFGKQEPYNRSNPWRGLRDLPRPECADAKANRKKRAAFVVKCKQDGKMGLFAKRYLRAQPIRDRNRRMDIQMQRRPQSRTQHQRLTMAPASPQLTPSEPHPPLPSPLPQAAAVLTAGDPFFSMQHDTTHLQTQRNASHRTRSLGAKRDRTGKFMRPPPTADDEELPDHSGGESDA